MENKEFIVKEDKTGKGFDVTITMKEKDGHNEYKRMSLLVSKISLVDKFIVFTDSELEFPQEIMWIPIENIVYFAYDM